MPDGLSDKAVKYLNKRIVNTISFSLECEKVPIRPIVIASKRCDGAVMFPIVLLDQILRPSRPSSYNLDTLKTGPNNLSIVLRSLFESLNPDSESLDRGSLLIFQARGVVIFSTGYETHVHHSSFL